MAGRQAMVKQPGTLYGVGVGPGDPELMTVKAWRLISTARVIAFLSANGGASTARSIAAPFIPEDAVELSLNVPMLAGREPARRAYDDGCKVIVAQLERGLDVVTLCEGDPFFYGSFMYIFSALAKTFKTVVVPGVTSLTATAASAGRPLAARDEVLKVIPATLPAERLHHELSSGESAAIIKVGRHFGKVRTVLNDLGLIENSLAVEYATCSHERCSLLASLSGDSLPYFSTILVYRGREPW